MVKNIKVLALVLAVSVSFCGIASAHSEHDHEHDHECDHGKKEGKTEKAEEKEQSAIQSFPTQK